MKNKFNTLSISIASVIGIVIYQFLKYIKYEKIDISMLVGYLLGNVLFLIFFYIKFKKNKSDKLPDYDERHKEIINNFVKNMFYIMVFIQTIAVLILDILDIKYISTRILLIYIIFIWIFLVFSSIIFMKKSIIVKK